jgi:tRNA threonylcarbamoyladenosine biosynthesis protein TsaB
MSVRILAIETSTHYGSVALSCGDVILYREVEMPRQHSVWILPAIEALLAEADLKKTQLNAISFGRGPGSFTGIRLATSIAQVTALAWDIPVIPVSTLQTLAQQALREHQCDQVLAALDARLCQVYWGCYQRDPQTDLMRRWGEELLDDPQRIQWPAELPIPWKGIGSGWENYPEYLRGEWIAGGYPKAYDTVIIARDEYRQGHVVSALEVQPLYLRNQVAHAAF